MEMLSAPKLCQQKKKYFVGIAGRPLLPSFLSFVTVTKVLLYFKGMFI